MSALCYFNEDFNIFGYFLPNKTCQRCSWVALSNLVYKWFSTWVVMQWTIYVFTRIKDFFNSHTVGCQRLNNKHKTIWSKNLIWSRNCSLLFSVVCILSTECRHPLWCHKDTNDQVYDKKICAWCLSLFLKV